MDELKELLQKISNQLSSIDIKLAVIANSVQQPPGTGRVIYHFLPDVFGTTVPDGQASTRG